MSLRTRVLEVVDIMMRVPPIFLIDEILKIGLGLPMQMDVGNITLSSSDVNATGFSANLAGGNVSSMSLTNDTITTTQNLSGAFTHSMSTMLNASTNRSFDEVIADASLSSLNRGILDTSLSTLIEILAASTCLVDILSVTLIKIAICLMGK